MEGEKVWELLWGEVGQDCGSVAWVVSLGFDPLGASSASCCGDGACALSWMLWDVRAALGHQPVTWVSSL